jgi:hypothetical protein
MKSVEPLRGQAIKKRPRGSFISISVDFKGCGGTLVVMGRDLLPIAVCIHRKGEGVAYGF